MAKKQKSKTITTTASAGLEERVVQVSLRHPDYGARRLLPFLDQEGITPTTSAVYTILKRNNLQNKALRLSKLEELRAAEMVPEPADTIEPPAKEPATVHANTVEKKPESPVPTTIKPPPKIKVRRPWSLSPFNILLLGLVGYFWVSAIGNLLNASRQPFPVAPSPAVDVAPKLKATVRPLEDYNIIIERNLFGVTREQASAPQEELTLEGLPVALKVLGLKLVGTVVGDDSAMSLAIIDNQSTRKQELYHEGDQVGQALLKKILRNKVVLSTGSGDEVLIMEFEEKAGGSSARPQTLASLPPTTPAESDDLTREEVESALPEYKNLMQQIRVRPHLEAGKPGGFMIYNIAPGSIYAKMGLENGDVIKSVNGQPIETTRQAVDFYNSLKEGGPVTLEIKRGESTQELRFAIQ